MFPRSLRICFNISRNLKIASLPLLVLSFPTHQALISDPVVPVELEANANLSLILCYPRQPHPHHHLPSHSSQPPAAARAGEARSWPLLHHQLTDICQTLFPLLFWPRFQPQSGRKIAFNMSSSASENPHWKDFLGLLTVITTRKKE